MEIKLDYNPYSIKGRLKFLYEHGDTVKGYERSVFGEGLENSKKQIVFVSDYGTEIYYK